MFAFYQVRDGMSTREQRKSSSKIIANLTAPSTDEQSNLALNNYQKQLSVQDTIQRHFSQMLKNDSITVTDNTTITETLLMRGKNSNNVHALSKCLFILLGYKEKIFLRVMIFLSVS